MQIPMSLFFLPLRPGTMHIQLLISKQKRKILIFCALRQKTSKIVDMLIGWCGAFKNNLKFQWQRSEAQVLQKVILTCLMFFLMIDNILVWG